MFMPETDCLSKHYLNLRTSEYYACSQDLYPDGPPKPHMLLKGVLLGL